MSSTSRENGKPLSTADLARAGRHGEGNPNADVEDTQDEATRLDVAQPPRSDRSKAAADPDMRERTSASPREARADARTGTSATAAEQVRDRDSGSRAVGDRIAGSAETARAGSSSSGEALEPLFASGLAASFRERWVSIQSGFVDDPKQAVRRGDELVAEVMSDLAQGFAAERQRMEAQLDETGEGATENLRVALRRYRSFFERLLSL